MAPLKIARESVSDEMLRIQVLFEAHSTTVASETYLPLDRALRAFPENLEDWFVLQPAHAVRRKYVQVPRSGRWETNHDGPRSLVLADLTRGKKGRRRRRSGEKGRAKCERTTTTTRASHRHSSKYKQNPWYACRLFCFTVRAGPKWLKRGGEAAEYDTGAPFLSFLNDRLAALKVSSTHQTAVLVVCQWEGKLVISEESVF